MVITEFYKTRFDGVNLYRTYSDQGRILIRNDGIEYSEAIDIENSGYTYIESDITMEDTTEAEAFVYDAISVST